MRRARPTGSIVVAPSVRGEGRATARVAVGGEARDVSFRVRGAAIHPHDDAFVPVALLLGMALRLPVVVEGPVSATLLETLPRARRDLLGLYDGLADAPLEARRPVPDAAHGPPGGVLCFLSGGLDSFYSVLTHRAEVTHAVFVHGFDVRLEEDALRALVSRSVRAAADDLGVGWVEVETDLRSLSDPHASWSWYSHAGLAAVSLLLSASFREILFGATLADRHRGAGRVPDERGRVWDNGLALVRRDGGEASRPEKARVVAASPVARDRLRVCWENRGGAYNCGVCAKCVRTAAALDLAGALGSFPGFPPALDLRALRAQRARRRSDRLFLAELVAEAERVGREDVAGAARRAMTGSPWRRALEALRALDRRVRRGRLPARRG